jgi:hypothetical protein
MPRPCDILAAAVTRAFRGTLEVNAKPLIGLAYSQVPAIQEGNIPRLLP